MLWPRLILLHFSGNRPASFIKACAHSDRNFVQYACFLSLVDEKVWYLQGTLSWWAKNDNKNNIWRPGGHTRPSPPGETHQTLAPLQVAG